MSVRARMGCFESSPQIQFEILFSHEKLHNNDPIMGSHGWFVNISFAHVVKFQCAEVDVLTPAKYLILLLALTFFIDARAHAPANHHMERHVCLIQSNRSYF